MKQYESVAKTRLTRRTPVIIRIDGKAHHTFTRGFVKPFDEVYMKTMQDTMKYLCENIQGCVLGYTQSDEISLVLLDYKKLTSEAWFDYEVEKVCSISASMATMAFNKFFFRNFNEYLPTGGDPKEMIEYCVRYSNASSGEAMFDSRCFNIPKEEVTNNIYWRQIDAIRNSIQMVGQANFSQKQLQNKHCGQIQEMLIKEKNIDWNDLPNTQKQGCCCIKTYNKETGRSKWIIDHNIPKFVGEGRKYIDDLVFI